MSAIKILPSILSADFATLGRDVAEAEAGGVDKVHFDVMDGRFVDNITIGLPVLRSLSQASSLPMDVHLMIVEPERYAVRFAEAGAETVTVHAEAATHLHGLLQQIKAAGARAGVALNPGTPLSAVDPVLGDLDLVLIMTVNPGFGGQAFIESQLPKIERLAGMIRERRLDVDIQVDGGIDPGTAPRVVAAGARELVAGSAIFSADVSTEAAARRLRAAAESGLPERQLAEA